MDKSNNMITLYNYLEKGINALMSDRKYLEIKYEKQIEEVNKEWNLLKKACEEKFKKLNKQTGYNTWMFYFLICGMTLCIDKLEEYHNKKESIERMKKYLGAWKR